MSGFDCIYIRSHLTISQLAILLAYTDMLEKPYSIMAVL